MERDFISLRIALLAIADDGGEHSIIDAIAARLTAEGHEITARATIPDKETAIRTQLFRWIGESLDVVIVCGDVESEHASAAFQPLVTKPMPGFCELFRLLAFQEIGAAAVQSNAEAAECGSTIVFVLPASMHAVTMGLDKLLVPQLDHRTKPRNLVMTMEGAQARLAPPVRNTPAPPKLPAIPSVPSAVPTPIEAEKTASGVTGGAIRPPASIARVVPLQQLRETMLDDVPTRPIELERLLPLMSEAAAPEKLDAPTKQIPIPKLTIPRRADTPPHITRFDATHVDVAKQVEAVTKIAPAPVKEAVTKVAPAPVKEAVTKVAPAPVKEAVTKVAPAPLKEVTKVAPEPPVDEEATHVEPPRHESIEPPTTKLPSKPRAVPIVNEATKKGVAIARSGLPDRAAPPNGGAESIARSGLPDRAAPESMDRGELKKRLPPVPPGADEFLEVEPEPLSSPEIVVPAPPEPPRPVATRRMPTPPPILDARSLVIHEQTNAQLPERPKPVTETKQMPAPVPRPPILPPLPPLPPREEIGAAGELPRGQFVYKRPPHRTRKIVTILGALVVMAAGFFLTVRILGTESEEPAKPGKPVVPEQVAVVTPDAEVAADASLPDEIQMDPMSAPDAGVASSHPPRKPVIGAGSAAKPVIGAGSAAKPVTVAGAGSAKPEPETPPEPTEPGCDEVSCALEHYAQACCAKFKKPESEFKPMTGTHDSLDKAMVKAGIENVKPVVIACGEKTPAKGTVKIAMVVAGDGHVTSASAEEAPDPALGACVAAALRKAKFAQTTNGASFTYPFVF